MPKFYYKILTKDQKVKEGNINAFNKRSAEKKLNKDGSTVILVSKEKSAVLQKSSFLSTSKFSSIEKINFFRNLSIMLGAGVSIVESLEIVADQVRGKRVKKTILKIAEDVKNGRRLSEAMAMFPRYFPGPMVATVNMGDLSGRLTETLDSISNDLEKDDEIRRKVISISLYPLIIVSLMVVVIVVLMVTVLPGIEKLYLEFNADLPLPTKILLSVSNFISLHPFILLGVIIGIIFFFLILLKLKRGRYMIHYLILKIPIFGSIIQDYNLVLFFRSLMSLIRSGMSIVDSVKIAKQTTKSDVYKKAIESIEPVLLHGIPLSETLIPFPFLFPPQTQKIMKVGEQTGKMEETFNHITKYYERSVEYKTRTAITLIEPILMILLGVGVAALALSVFLPLYSMIKII